MGSETVTVHVWQGGRLDSYDDLLEREPDVYEVTVAETDYGMLVELSDDERIMLAESIDHHGTYAFDVPDESRPATVNVHTNDSYHDREDWGDAVERGLTYREGDEYEPFKCELWRC